MSLCMQICSCLRLKGVSQTDGVLALQFLHHYRINQKQTPQLGRLLARIFAPVLLAPDDIDVDFQTDVSVWRSSAGHIFAGVRVSRCCVECLWSVPFSRVCLSSTSYSA